MADPDERQYEWHPLTIYDSAFLAPGERAVQFDFGASNASDAFHRLWGLAESELIQKALHPPAPLAGVLRLLGIDYPHCWILLDSPTKVLVPSFPYEKPGDVDLITGSVRDDRPDFGSVLAMQVKRRRTTGADQVLSFPSGVGTAQAHYTARLGFDRTLLLHFFVREPRPTPADHGDSWSPILNSDCIRPAKASAALVRKSLSEGREWFGYGRIGWGQAYGEDASSCGGVSHEIILEPPLRPWRSVREVLDRRAVLEKSLEGILLRHRGASLPMVLRWSAGSGFAPI